MTLSFRAQSRNLVAIERTASFRVRPFDFAALRSEPALSAVERGDKAKREDFSSSVLLTQRREGAEGGSRRVREG